MKYDVLGLGNPLIDVIVNVEDNLLTRLGIQKGSMNLVDVTEQKKILEATQEQATTALGGSCGNSMAMLAQLGSKAAFLGNLGEDDLGRDYERQLVASGVSSYLQATPGATGSTVILITPDAERSMNTHLGNCQMLSGASIDEAAIKAAKYIYIEGYLWDTDRQKEAVRKAVTIAKAAGTKISLTLSDSFCVSRHKDEFQDLMDNYVDLLFCNEAEAEMMTGKTEPEEQLKQLSGSVPHVVITLGSKGAMVIRDGEITHVDSFAVKALDTTGAGDSFAAGYLHGISQGYNTKDAATLASFCAATIVSQIGPRFDGDLQAQVNAYLK